MSMISRYKKEGGFVQLVQLIESCDEAKRQNFLRMIECESLDWASALKMKMLTVERIFSWEGDVIAKISGIHPEEVISILLSEYKGPVTSHILPGYSEDQRDRIVTSSENHSPTPKELSRAKGQFITEVRKNLTQGSLSLENIDKDLHVYPGIEEELIAGRFKFPEAIPSSTKIVTGLSAPTPSRPGQSALERKIESESSGDIVELRAKLEEMQNRISTFAYQNHRLRRENKVLQEQLDHLKKSS